MYRPLIKLHQEQNKKAACGHCGPVILLLLFLFAFGGVKFYNNRSTGVAVGDMYDDGYGWYSSEEPGEDTALGINKKTTAKAPAKETAKAPAKETAKDPPKDAPKDCDNYCKSVGKPLNPGMKGKQCPTIKEGGCTKSKCCNEPEAPKAEQSENLKKLMANFPKNADTIPDLMNHCKAQAEQNGKFTKPPYIPLYTDSFLSNCDDTKVYNYVTLQDTPDVKGLKKLNTQLLWEDRGNDIDAKKCYFRARHYVVYCIVNVLISLVEQANPGKEGLAMVSAPGSTDPDSDIDVSINGKNALEIVEGYYAVFEKYFNKVSSMEKFDANLYVGPFLLNVPDSKLCTDYGAGYAQFGLMPHAKKQICILGQHDFTGKDQKYGNYIAREFAVAIKKLTFFIDEIHGVDYAPIKEIRADNFKLEEKLWDHMTKVFNVLPQHNKFDLAGYKDTFVKLHGEYKTMLVNLKKSEAKAKPFLEQDNLYRAFMSEYMKDIGSADTAPPSEEGKFGKWHELMVKLSVAAQESYFSRGPFMTVVVGDQTRGAPGLFNDDELDKALKFEDFVTSAIENLADLIKDWGHILKKDNPDYKKFVLKASKYMYRYLEAILGVLEYYGSEGTMKAGAFKGLDIRSLTDKEVAARLNKVLIIFYGIRFLCRAEKEKCEKHCFSNDGWEQMAKKMIDVSLALFKRGILGDTTEGLLATIKTGIFTEQDFYKDTCSGKTAQNAFVGQLIVGVQRLGIRRCKDTAKDAADPRPLCNWVNNRGPNLALPATTNYYVVPREQKTLVHCEGKVTITNKEGVAKEKTLAKMDLGECRKLSNPKIEMSAVIGLDTVPFCRAGDVWKSTICKATGDKAAKSNDKAAKSNDKKGAKNTNLKEFSN